MSTTEDILSTVTGSPDMTTTTESSAQAEGSARTEGSSGESTESETTDVGASANTYGENGSTADATTSETNGPSERVEEMTETTAGDISEDASESGSSSLGCPEDMVLIESGSFVDGSELAGTHDIVAFCLDRTEVTVARYSACVDEGYCPEPETFVDRMDYNYGGPGREEHPVNGVSWFEAQNYCAWAAGRLPTEWEWEWAARGRDEGREYPWGDGPTPTCTSAVINDDAAGGFGCGSGTTATVGSRSPDGDSLDGVVDMAGNVWEWTASLHTTGSDERVLRGGAWNSYGFEPIFRTSYRNAESPSFGNVYIGFRCARTL